MGCGCRGGGHSTSTPQMSVMTPQNNGISGGYSVKDFCEQENMVKVKYNGPIGTHIVPSPLRKFTNYGMHTNGDIFCVHVDDQRMAPYLFEPIVDDSNDSEEENLSVVNHSSQAEGVVSSEQTEKQKVQDVESAKKRGRSRKEKESNE